ncbi:transcription antitermination factor NusB [Haploplasma axanthum]|nr:transcription antitermination factor NusB [Haploplasma axanthum]
MEKNLKNMREDLINYLYQKDLLSLEDLEIEDLETYEAFNDINNKLNEIDDIISANLFNYSIDRLSYIDRAIIRLATYELKFSDVAPAVIINEAIKLTKKYSDLDDEKQHKFNNKVIDNINKSLRG